MQLPCLRSLFLITVGMLTVCAQSGYDAQRIVIQQVVDEYLNARQQRDPAAVGDLFTADADQLVSSGEWRKGREALVKGTLASSERTGGKRTITIETFRFLAPDVVIADGRYEISGLTGGAARHMWSTFVMTHSSGKWRIAAIRNMLPAPPAPSATAK